MIFDVGGVLIRTHERVLREEWERRLGLQPGQSHDFVFESVTGRDVQLGRMPVEQHWESVRRQLGLSESDLRQFRVDFFAGDRLDQELAAWAKRARAHYHIGVLSNASADMRRVLREMYGISDLFDSITISGEEGVMKPDPEIYRIAVARAGVRPEEALFIDDVPANVDGAQAAGLRAWLFDDPAGILHRLQAETGVA